MAKTKLDMLKQILNRSEVPFSFLGNKAILSMKNGNIAEVTLHESMTKDYYKSLMVKIINPNSGVITSDSFNFEQYFGKKADRSHPNARDVNKMYVWCDDWSVFDWYIVKPTDTIPIIDAVLEFITIYNK